VFANADDFSANNYEKKRTMIEQNKGGGGLADIDEAGALLTKLVQKDIPRFAVAVGKSVKKGLTPGFIKRYSTKKVHTKEVEKTESKLDRLHAAANKTIRDELAFKRERQRHNRLTKEAMAAKKHIREEVHEKLEDAHKITVEEEFQAFHKRRDEQLAEYQTAVDLAVRQQLERDEEEEVKHRRWRIQFYGQQAQEQRMLLEKTNEKAVRDQRNQAKLDRTFDEYEGREDARTHLQVEVPPADRSIGLPGVELGIFRVKKAEVDRRQLMQDGGRVEAKEELSDDELAAFPDTRGGRLPREEWFLEDVDQMEVHPLDTGPYPEYENAQMDAADLQSDLIRAQQLYDAVQYEASNLIQAVDKMHDMREKLERDQRQVNEEVLVIQKEQLGPPRRLAMAHEIPAIDSWKSQNARITKRLLELQHAEEVTLARKQAADAQLVPLARHVAVLQQRVAESGEQLREINGEHGLLPMIIGRSLTQVPGMDRTAKPLEAFNAITHKARLVKMRDDSEKANDLHKEVNVLNQQMWLTRIGESSKRIDLERMISRIADISSRLKTSSTAALRANIIDSLNAFTTGPMQLRTVYQKMVGVLPWYNFHVPELSQNCARYVAKTAMGGISFELTEDANSEALSAGVTMGRGKLGFCTGVIQLPKEGLWNLIVTVSRRGDGEQFDSQNPSDFCAVQVGPTVASMSPVGTYYNEVNPATGTVLYDVKHLFHGRTFAFRFDFSSSSEDPLKHLAVSTGLYEQYELADLEEVSDPKLVGRKRVLSSLVKMIKIESKTGKGRETRLLEELVICEESTAVWWDSEIVSQTMQRYAREFFLRLLRAEILLQQEVSKARAIRAAEEASIMRAAMNDADVLRDAKLEQSEKKYLQKKRAVQRNKLDAGRDLVGKRIILWDDGGALWRNLTILEVLVAWVENGLVARVTHLAQEYTDTHEKIAAPKEINLSNFKYFESPVQVLDPEVIARAKERKMWDEAIVEIEVLAREEIDEMRQRYREFRLRQEKLMRKTRRKVFEAFEATIQGRAEEAGAASVATRALRVLLSAVMLDIKKGIVPVEDDEKPKDVGRAVALVRFKETFVTNRREELSDQFDKREVELGEMLQLKFEEYDAQRHAVLKTAKKDREELQELIRQQLQARRAILLKRVKFPRGVFDKAVPRAFNCEHLRTKAWGDKYGMGVRCLECGSELNDLHKEESQMLGYGSGADVKLWEAVTRHRVNECTFRFESSEQLAAVEEERIRLEKEKRMLFLDEAYFYDFQDLPVIYQFDRRHAMHIKKAGIFRQGLQWREDELEFFEFSKITRERERLEAAGLPVALMDSFDPLNEIEEPPPTFRAIEEKHRAQYSQLVYSVGRLHNFNRRIHVFKMERFEYLAELDVFAQVLDSLHKDSYLFETTLSDLEKDLDRTSKLLGTYNRMQALWSQASLILSQAKREKAKADMNRVGLWADVKECQDRTTVLHDETRTLLRFKLTTDSKLDYQSRSVDTRTVNVADCHRKRVEAQYKAESLHYCMPGNLVYVPMFGQCFITAFRQKDDMLMILLPFGHPPAKAFVHYKQVIELERSKQQGERLLMGIEDQQMGTFMRAERITVKKELYAMRREEEGLRQYYNFIDLGKNEEVALREAITQSVDVHFVITESRKYRQAQAPNVKKQLQAVQVDNEERRKEYIGPPSGKPQKLGAWARYQQRKLIEVELKEKFIAAAANRADEATRTALHHTRSNFLQTNSFQALIDGVIKEMILEVAADSHTEGRVAKGFAEKKSGIIFPDPTWMQFGTYASLSSIWRGRKDELQRTIELNKAEVLLTMALNPSLRPKEKLSMDPAEVKKRRVVRLARLAEDARQLQLCEEMAAEEVSTRLFYRWELKENLRERRLMKEEDNGARKLRAAEWKALKDARDAYALLHTGVKDHSEVGGGEGTSEPGPGKAAPRAGGGPRLTTSQAAELKAKSSFTYEQRRQDLKDLTVERRRVREDQAQMILEDEAGKVLRQTDLADRARKAYIAEFGEEESTGEGEGEGGLGGGSTNIEMKQLENLDYLEQMVVMKKPLPVPEYIKPPKGFDDWDVRRRNEYLKIQIQVTAKRNAIERSAAKEMMRMVRLENTSYDEWQGKFRIYELQEAEAELAAMEAEEELKEYESKLRDIRDNILRVTTFCRDKGEEELRSRMELKRREQLARQRDLEVEEAEGWLAVCMRRARTRDKLKRRVRENCMWVDTDSINGFHQRFATQLLRERLYMTYFRQIVASIVNRSEIIATERKLLMLQESLSINKAHLQNKKNAMTGLLGDIRRDDFMRMRRSMLNEKMFGPSRKQTLSQRFGGWLRYFWWRRGNTEAFTMKFEIIKRQLDIDRQFKEQLRTQADADRQIALELATGKPSKPLPIRTLMQKHRERTVQCRKCLKLYLDSQNISMACQYHPKQFVMHCPASCPNPGLTVLCAAHRKRRWTCCDATKNDAAGCSRRYHCPPASDLVYDKIMGKINERDQDMLRDLDGQLIEARKQDWPAKKNHVKRERVFQIEDLIEKDRKTAKRIDDLKFV